MLPVLLLVVIAVVPAVAVVREVRSDGYGRRPPPPACHPDPFASVPGDGLPFQP